MATRQRRKPIRLNPWGLTPRQEDVMRAITTTGCQKLVARHLGISLSTVEQHAWEAKAAMRLRDPKLANGVLCYIAFARWDERRAAILEEQLT